MPSVFEQLASKQQSAAPTNGGVSNLHPNDYGAIGTGVAAAKEEAAPAVAGLAGGITGAGVATAMVGGGEAMATLNPLVGGAVVAIGGIIGGWAASEGARHAQDMVEKAAMGGEAYDKYKQDLYANYQKYPLAHLVGSLAPQLTMMHPDVNAVGRAVGTARELVAAKNGIEWASQAENRENVMEMLGVLTNAGAQGGINLTQQLQQTGNLDVMQLAGNIALGAVMNKPTAFTEALGAKIGGPMGEILTRNITRDRKAQATQEQADLNQQADDFVSQFTQEAAQGQLTKQRFDEYQAKAKELRRLQVLMEGETPEAAVARLNQQQSDIAKMSEDSISSAKTSRDQELQLAQAQSDMLTKTFGDKTTGKGGSYKYGIDRVADENRDKLIQQAQELGGRLNDANKQQGNEFYKNQLSQQLSNVIDQIHAIKARTPKQQLRDFKKDLDTLTTQKISDVKKTASDLTEDIKVKQMYAEEAAALKPQEQPAQQQTTVSPEAKNAVATTLDDLRHTAEKMKAAGRLDAADPLLQRISDIEKDPSVLSQIEKLQKLAPQHPAVQELLASKAANDVVGTKAQTEAEKPFDNLNDPERTAAVVAKLDQDKMLKTESQVVDQYAPLKRLSQSAKQGVSEAQGKITAGLHKLTERMQRATDDLYASSKLTGRKFEDVKQEAHDYLQAKAMLEYNNLKGEDGYLGVPNAELQARISKVEASPNYKAIKKYEAAYRESINENIDRMVEAKTLSKESADWFKKNTPNYVPLDADRSLYEAYAGKNGYGRKEFGAANALKERTKSNGEIERLDPLTTLIKQRNGIENALFKRRVLDSLKQEAKTNKDLASVLEFDYKPKDGEPKGSYLEFRMPDGKMEYVKVKSLQLARAMNGLDKETVPDMLNFFGKLNRFIADMAVHKNPMFAPVQIAYDFWAQLQNISATPIAGKRIELLTNWIKSFPTAIKAGLRGADKLTGADAKMFNEFVEDGGSWHMNAGGKADETAKAIWKQAAAKNGDSAAGAMYGVLHDITHVNEVLPDALRFGAYKTAREAGLSRSKAVEAAQKIMPNYLDRGSAMRAISNYKIFVNASIQGTKRFIESTFYDKNGKFDPRGAMAFFGASLAAQSLIRTNNDAKDPYWREKWNADRNWIFVQDKTHALSIPMEWAQRPIHQLMGMLVDAGNGKHDFSDKDVHTLMIGALEAYSPLGSGSLKDIFVPTFAQPMVDVDQNIGYARKPILGAGLQDAIKRGLPAHMAFYDDMTKNLLGLTSIEGTKALSSLGVEMAPQQMQYMLQQWFSAPAQFAQGTIGQRFYKEMTPDRAQQIEDEAGQSKLMASVSDFNKQAEIEKFQHNKEISNIVAQIRSLPQAEQKAEIMRLAGNDYETAFEVTQAMAKATAKAQMTAEQVAYNKVPKAQLASFIIQQAKSLGDPALQDMYLDHLIEAKILSGKSGMATEKIVRSALQ